MTQKIYMRMLTSLITISFVLQIPPTSLANIFEDPRYSRIHASVWSSYSGWGLEVDDSNATQTPHSSYPLVRYSLLLPLGDTDPHPPRPGEGITLTVLNQRKANVLFHKVFPLGLYWAHYADLQWHVDRVAPGRIVVITVAVSGAIGLRQAAQQLQSLGSLFAMHLTPMAHWTWVFVKGGRTISETVVLHGSAQHRAHLTLPLSPIPTPFSHINETNNMQQKRWQYCQLHGAMGGLCDEHNPDILPPPSPSTLPRQADLARVPVVVTAGARHQYLYHTLRTLLTAPGAQRNNVLVVLGDAPQSTTQLLRLIDVNFTKVPVHGSDNLKLFRYYRNVFQLVASTFPDAPAVIFLDEDVEVSPDFFSFMSQTIWLLQADPTLYCVNGYGGVTGLYYSETKLLRADAQVSWGYAISLNFVKEALILWQGDNINSGSLYDYWLYDNVAKGRECVMPAMSRSRHYGVGTNTEAWIHETHFQNNQAVRTSGVQLQKVDQLQLPLWRQNLEHSIRVAKPLTGNPCSDTFLRVSIQNKVSVFYVKMNRKTDGSPDISDYFYVAHCLGIWGFSPHGLHEGVRTLQTSSNSILHIVGVPYSSYSFLRPYTLRVWTMRNATAADEQIIQKRFASRSNINVANVNFTSADLLASLSLNNN